MLSLCRDVRREQVLPAPGNGQEWGFQFALQMRMPCGSDQLGLEVKRLDFHVEDLGFVSDRHNRTAVGVRADGTVLLVVIDGRAPEAAGMSLQELQQVMRWLGCHTALNLDGGGSATFYADWGGNHGVLNCPSDNGRFDHEGERAVSNAVLVVRKQR